MLSAEKGTVRILTAKSEEAPRSEVIWFGADRVRTFDLLVPETIHSDLGVSSLLAVQIRTAGRPVLPRDVERTQ